MDAYATGAGLQDYEEEIQPSIVRGYQEESWEPGDCVRNEYTSGSIRSTRGAVENIGRGSPNGRLPTNKILGNFLHRYHDAHGLTSQWRKWLSPNEGHDDVLQQVARD